MNQVISLEHVIDLAETMTKSKALRPLDQRYGKIIQTLLIELVLSAHFRRHGYRPETTTTFAEPGEILRTMGAYANSLSNTSEFPEVANYFIDYGEGKQLYQDMASALNIIVQKLHNTYSGKVPVSALI